MNLGETLFQNEFCRCNSMDDSKTLFVCGVCCEGFDEKGDRRVEQTGRFGRCAHGFFIEFLPLLEIAHVLLRLDQVASSIVNANHRVL